MGRFGTAFISAEAIALIIAETQRLPSDAEFTGRVWYDPKRNIFEAVFESSAWPEIVEGGTPIQHPWSHY